MIFAIFSACFDITKHYILPTEHRAIDVFCVVLRVNIDYLPTQIQLSSPCNGD
jgi:hypothetical protein